MWMAACACHQIDLLLDPLPNHSKLHSLAHRHPRCASEDHAHFAIHLSTTFQPILNTFVYLRIVLDFG